MNKARRKRIYELVDRIDTIRDELNALAEEEREALGNLPESLQDGEKGQAMEEAASELEDVSGELEEAIDRLREVTGG